MRLNLFILAVVAVVCSLCLCASPVLHRVTSLPGLSSPFPFELHTTHIPTASTPTQPIFMALFEDPARKEVVPTIIWFQGGPGCSSMMGMFTENGPVTVTGPDSLRLNDLSWLGVANLLYVDSPAGVGFSTAPGASFSTNDTLTAVAAREALEGFFLLRPDLLRNGFVLSGESYAGSYVPFLAREIITHSQLLSPHLGALAIGNPVMSCSRWRKGGNTTQVELFYWHGLIPLSAKNEWYAAGCGGDAPPIQICATMMHDLNVLVGLHDGTLNSDNLYTDFIAGNASLTFGSTTGSPRTVTDDLTAYLNRPDVQEALFAGPVTWQECAGPPQLLYTSDWPSMLPFYDFFAATGREMPILIYSGDVDIATCPHAYTQLCLDELNWPKITKWRQWTTPNKAVAGFMEQRMKNNIKLTFATVKGAGHETPEFQPLAALTLLKRWAKEEW